MEDPLQFASKIGARYPRAVATEDVKQRFGEHRRIADHDDSTTVRAISSGQKLSLDSPSTQITSNKAVKPLL